jgi:hypothetical protein
MSGLTESGHGWAIYEYKPKIQKNSWGGGGSFFADGDIGRGAPGSEIDLEIDYRCNLKSDVNLA